MLPFAQDDGWDFGTGAGFYVDATEPGWKDHVSAFVLVFFRFLTTLFFDQVLTSHEPFYQYYHSHTTPKKSQLNYQVFRLRFASPVLTAGLLGRADMLRK